jgi:hypothetical protein
MDISIVNNPMYDESSLTPAIESARIEFLDFGKL